MGIGTPITNMTTGLRHMLDANVTFGQSSERYNARDKYRNSYTDGQRTSAGIGTALGVALPVAAGVAWAQRGMKVPGLPVSATPALMQNAGRAVGIAGLGLAAGIGVKKSIEITKDDGHLGAVGAGTGILAGAAAGIAVGTRVGGTAAAFSAGAGALVGGVAGHFGGKAVKVGESQVGVEHVQAPNTDATVGDRAKSFASGAFNHFNEVGPTTSGISFGYQWGLQDAVKTKYSNSERAGAMHGDLLAAGILGGGALAVAGGLMGTVGAKEGATAIGVGSKIAEKVVSRGALTGMIHKLGDKGALGVGAAAAGIAGAVAIKEWDRSMDANGSKAASAAYAGGILAATAGTAALVSRSSAVSHLAAAPKAASSALAAAALIGVLSTARLPLQQFMNDAKDSVAADGGIKWGKAAVPAGIGVVGGGLGAAKVLNKLIPESGIWKIPKWAITGAGAAATAAAGGGIGIGLSSTMPDDPKQLMVSTAGGAAAGLAFAGLARGVNAKAGLMGGAALGLSASALLRADTPAPTEAPTVQDVAGAAT